MIFVIASLLAIIGFIGLWACGVGVFVSLICLVLKWCGVVFLASMSSWTPLIFFGGWLLSFTVAAIFGALAHGLAQ